jgi:antitoxin MazE
MQVKISKWGNSIGVRVPKDVAEKLGLKDGTNAELSVEKGRIVIDAKRRQYSLEELLVGMTPEAMHKAFDWGPDKGRENVD